MELDYAQRSIRLSAGEFAQFRTGPAERADIRGMRWRMEAGSAWHREIQERTLKENPQARTEVSIEGKLAAGGWTLHLQGRIDLVLEREAGMVLQELKTVCHSLPMDEEALLARYPAYALQAGVYQLLWALAQAGETETPRSALAELVFIELSSGILQHLPLPIDINERVLQQAGRIAAFAEERARRASQLAHLRYRFPFENFREGQAEAWQALQAAGKQISHGSAQCLAFQAPTGFGKTGLALSLGIELIRDGAIDRIIFLSSKATGQLQAMAQLEGMLAGAESSHLRVVQLRSRRDHASGCPVALCPGVSGRHCREDIASKWDAAEPDLPGCLQAGSFGLEQAQILAGQTQLCSYELAREALPLAEAWVGDYNYIFSPRHRALAESVFDFQPPRTFLIVDEAHNLPDRVAASMSQRFSLIQAQIMATELADLGAEQGFRRLWDGWQSFLESLLNVAVLELNQEYEAISWLEQLAEVIGELALDYDAISPQANDALSAFGQAARCLAELNLQWLWHVPEAGVLEMVCLDASSWIAARLQSFGGSLLMSATMAPEAVFEERLGMEPGQLKWIQGEAPWREAAYRVQTNPRIDTRYKQRKGYYLETAESIAAFYDPAAGPLAVFFPSYRYAEDIGQYLQAGHAHLRLAQQPRGADLDAQTAFLESALMTADILLLVLGGSFAEGIDLLGGRVQRAVVVGPALPEVNAIQDARLEALSQLNRSEAFRRVYQIPGITKINQALGRFVRAPGQTADILFIGKRFSDASYTELLDPVWRPSE